MNEMNSCTICQRETSRMACDRCESRMRRQLNDIPRMMIDASGNLIPGQGGDGRSTERTLGINLAALDACAGFDAIAVLESWERVWREDYDLTPYGPASYERTKNDCSNAQMLRGIVGFLLSWLTKSCDEHPAIDEFSRELHDIYRQMQQATGETKRAAWRVTCPADTQDGECGTQLRVTQEDFDGHVSCRGCGTNWPTDRLLRVVASSKHAELWLDPEAAAEWIGVHAGTLRKWAVEGRIKREHGRYEVHSLKALVGA